MVDRDDHVQSDVGQFVILPVWVLTADISPRAILLYGVLLLRADKERGCHQLRKTLAAFLRTSPKSVDRAIQELVAIGALTVTPRYGTDGRQRANSYTVRVVRPTHPLVTRDQPPSSPVTSPPSSPVTSPPSSPVTTRSRSRSCTDQDLDREGYKDLGTEKDREGYTHAEKKTRARVAEHDFAVVQKGGHPTPNPPIVHPPPALNPHAKPTNLVNGAELRRHGTHAWCSFPRDGLCITHDLHSEFMGKGAKSSAEMIAFYTAEMSRYEGVPIGDDKYRFWRNRFAAWIGMVTAEPRPLSKQEQRKAEINAEVEKLRQKVYGSH